MGRRKAKNPAAVALGRRGGYAAAGKGGRTRWAGVPAAERARLMEKVRAARAKKRKRRT